MATVAGPDWEEFSGVDTEQIYPTSYILAQAKIFLQGTVDFHQTAINPTTHNISLCYGTQGQH